MEWLQSSCHTERPFVMLLRIGVYISELSLLGFKCHLNMSPFAQVMSCHLGPILLKEINWDSEMDKKSYPLFVEFNYLCMSSFQQHLIVRHMLAITYHCFPVVPVFTLISLDKYASNGFKGIISLDKNASNGFKRTVTFPEAHIYIQR